MYCSLDRIPWQYELQRLQNKVQRYQSEKMQIQFFQVLEDEPRNDLHIYHLDIDIHLPILYTSDRLSGLSNNQRTGLC